MVDLFVDDITYERLDVTADGYRIILRNKSKEESVQLIFTEEEITNIYFALKRRLETNNVIPIK